MKRFALLVMLCAALAGCGGAEPADAPVKSSTNQAKAETPAPLPLADKVRVRLETEAGPIVVELDGRRAPITTANFLAYAE